MANTEGWKRKWEESALGTNLASYLGRYKSYHEKVFVFSSVAPKKVFG
jgi:hypothetical protein